MSQLTLFADWQPRYAAVGIATFPVDVAAKKPAVRGYLTLGPERSAALAPKTWPARADGLGFVPGRRSGVVVVDVDNDNPAALRAALEYFGPTPYFVKTPRGWHLYYKPADFAGRIIGLDIGDGFTVDLLAGNGFAVAPPSPNYRFGRGGLDDIAAGLPIIENTATAATGRDSLSTLRRRSALGAPVAGELIAEGRRNVALLWHLHRVFYRAADLEDLTRLAFAFADAHLERGRTFPDSEIENLAAKVWRYRSPAVGAPAGSFPLPAVDVEALGPDAFALCALLEYRSGGAARFHVPDRLPLPWAGWGRRRLPDARQALEDVGVLVKVRKATGFEGENRRALFRWGAPARHVLPARAADLFALGSDAFALYGSLAERFGAVGAGAVCEPWGWDARRLRAARQALEDAEALRRVRGGGGGGGAAVYELV